MLILFVFSLGFQQLVLELYLNRATVASIQEKNPDCTLEYVEQEIVKEIDVRKREWNED